MTQTITVTPNERGTAVVTVTPTDEDGNALTFEELTTPKWQLMRSNGTVINGRTFSASSMTSLTFVLSGDDLVLFGKSDNQIRVLSFSATYNSTAGNGLPLIAECKFKISAVVGQVDETRGDI